jgi:Flp pilus assembly protein TadD
VAPIRVLSLPVSILGCALVFLGGCASTPADTAPIAKAPADLYAGQPATVHATEYPVTAAVEGVQRGDVAWQQGNLDLAIYLYVQALQFEPNDAATLRKIGAIHESRNNRTLARKAFELALTRGGEHVATMERLGLIYLQDEHNDQAHALLARVVELDPQRWRSYNGLGVLADRRGQHTDALVKYGAALIVEPKAGVVYNNRGYSKFLDGDLVGAEKDLREAIRLGSSERAWLNLGKVQAKARQYGVAFKSFLETLDTAHAYNEVGEAAMRNGDHQIAKAYFENATNASPIYFEQAHKNLAVANEELLDRTPKSGS